MALVGRVYSVNETPLRGTTPISGSPSTVPKSGVYEVDDTQPVVRLVTLFHHPSLRAIDQTVSAADGSFQFKNWGSGSYFVIAWDHTGQYNAAIATKGVAIP